jgi:hypothetical protein
MAATRLSEAQKTELVARFRNGDTSQELAGIYGCSAITVSRVVKAALDPAEYEGLKQRRGRRGSALAAEATADVAVPTLIPAEPEPELPITSAPVLDAAVPAAPQEANSTTIQSESGDGDDDAAATSLAIDDADDFGDDGESSEDEDNIDGGEDDDADVFLVIPLTTTVVDDTRPSIEAQPLEQATLPSSVYMLVDKTVELQARPLREFSDLQPLADEEQDRQALHVFANPRHAKRQCGRTQRVIKVPDVAVFQLTAPYLLKQGITRLVVEGALYALPGS